MYAEYGDRVLRRLFTPRWLGALAGAIVFGIICVFLGQWQWGRHMAKVERNARLDVHYRADPLPLRDVMGTGPLPLAAQWTRVAATGVYEQQAQLYVRNRPNNGVYGYEVLIPLVKTDGSRVLVNRGWVTNSDQGADVLPPVPPAPLGQVTVIGWALPSEQSLSRHLPPGQIASINIDDAEKLLGEDLLGGFVVLDREETPSGQTPPRPEPLATPDRSLGPNQAYAYQWWVTSLAGFVVIWLGIRRELREENPELVKPKKHRIWDDEDE